MYSNLIRGHVGIDAMISLINQLAQKHGLAVTVCDHCNGARMEQSEDLSLDGKDGWVKAFKREYVRRDCPKCNYDGVILAQLNPE